jgi:transposase
LLRRQVSLFLFAFVSGVEPTKDAAERALRHGVLWRKVSHGPKSAVGFDLPGEHLVGGGDVPPARSRGVGFPDGLHGHRVCPADVAEHAQYYSSRLTFKWIEKRLPAWEQFVTLTSL